MLVSRGKTFSSLTASIAWGENSDFEETVRDLIKGGNGHHADTTSDRDDDAEEATGF